MWLERISHSAGFCPTLPDDWSGFVLCSVHMLMPALLEAGSSREVLGGVSGPVLLENREDLG